MAQQIVKLRIFDDTVGRLNRSLQDVQGELLLIPQITLTASLAKGTCPSFHTAASPESARVLFETLVQEARDIYPRVLTGVFQSHMVVNLENDGPVTFVLADAF
jgi:D-tyrosyl-tRNA(Tyr) deacylase